MRYVQLRAFHYVAISGGFSRAAEALCLTQPAISDQVRKLEEEYDILLFNRHKKSVRLTRAGEDLLEITRRLFDCEQQALELLSESRALRAGTLRIIADAAHHLLPVLAEFRRRRPGVRITLLSGNSQEVVASLFAYDSDIGVLGDFPAGREFETLDLGSSPIVAFMQAGHALAGRKSITVGELASHPLVLREAGSKTRQKIEAEAAREGTSLEAAIEAEGREAVREIVAAGAGIGVVSLAEFGNDPRLVHVPIEGENMSMQEALICLSERRGGKTVNAFLECAAEFAAGNAA